MRRIPFIFMLLYTSCDTLKDQSTSTVPLQDIETVNANNDEQDLEETEPSGKEVLANLNAVNDKIRIPPHIFSKILYDVLNNSSLTEEEKIGGLLKHAEANLRTRSHVLEVLTYRRCKKLGPWLLKHWRELDRSDWNSISSALYDQVKEKNPWNDEKIIYALKKYGLLNTKGYFKANVIRSLELIDSQSEVLKLIPLLDVETDPYIRFDLYVGLPRFDHPRTNETIRKLLNDLKEPGIITTMIQYWLVDNNRYDFIPDLKQLRAKLIKINDVTQKAQAQEIIEIIDKTIPKLERIKSSGVPVGEPQEKDSESQKLPPKLPAPNTATDTSHPFEH